MGLPGALPVVNINAVKKAIALGKALNATVNATSSFERKKLFFTPTCPVVIKYHSFQIPVVEKGSLSIDYEDGSTKCFNITRAHLETDAGKKHSRWRYFKGRSQSCRYATDRDRE